MKFGKYIQAHQVPGWSAFYLDYKFLKKIISSLAANRPASEAAALALGVRPVDANSPTDGQSPGAPPIFSDSQRDEDRGPDFRAHKAAFFFKLERELEKINAFYLQKEDELRRRLETLLSKRRAAAMRGFPDSPLDTLQNNVEWSAVEEGFRLLERDLIKIQQFVDVNATGFRKILKKYDKRSISTTKELYLSRQVEVQPVFNRQLISELSDTVAACLLDLTDLSSGLKFEGAGVSDIVTKQLTAERTPFVGPFRDLEKNLRKAIVNSDATALSDCVRFADVLSQDSGSKVNVDRIIWSVVIEAPPDFADLILSSLTTPFDFQFIDDINGRTCLHEAAIAGAPRLVNMCLEKGVQKDKVDVYGRTALHYSAINGDAIISQRLIEAKLPLNSLDMDNYSPLIYATMKGSVDCVKVLLGDGEYINPKGSDLLPLSLACEAGHVDVVLLLLQHGAKCSPNSNGEYPMHLAAREGHVEVCKHLLFKDGWDTPDKYHEWTPLFHATRYGRDACVWLLLEAGSRVNLMDELGHQAVHYAGFYGHIACLNYLLDAAKRQPLSNDEGKFPDTSPGSDDVSSQMEIDLIPSLSLPPPIMPHRVYGHSYLDRSHLVQIYLDGGSALRLHHRVMSPAFKDEYLLASALLKLVISCGSDANAAPHTISLPDKTERGVYFFQIPSLNSMSLEFSIYPNFGTKTIGRAISLPSMFNDIENKKLFVLPIVDSRLHTIGEISFGVNVVTAFESVTLEIGGDIQTYWKSTSTSNLVPPPSSATLPWPHRSSLIASAQTSPASQSVSNLQPLVATISSLKGQHLHLIIQVTRDLVPVVFSEWLLPESSFNLGVSDVTLAQFDALALRIGRQITDRSPSNWAESLSRAMVSLADLLKILPPSLGISFELAYPSKTIVRRFALGRRLELNLFVDAVLRAIYQSFMNREVARHGISFLSFSPDVCAALNWKQPNYPVFFASNCGMAPSRNEFIYEDEGDRRLSSLGAAVEFAKTNNLLGIFVNAELLLQVPSLINGIRGAGLLVGIHETLHDSSQLTTASSIAGSPVDAFGKEGTITFVTNHLDDLWE